ncbi:MAG: HAMP domain-containing histidine kinase [Lewinellaceae bacterium]|nr:HAMP domain-containing histidine kinase [Lewinellaceae bacterium]
MAERKQIDFSVELPPQNTPAVLLDQEKFRQILFNLLANAFKFTPNGGRIETAVSVEAGMLHLRVADTGPGIHPTTCRTCSIATFRPLALISPPRAAPASGWRFATTTRNCLAEPSRWKVYLAKVLFSRWHSRLPGRKPKRLRNPITRIITFFQPPAPAHHTCPGGNLHRSQTYHSCRGG